MTLKYFDPHPEHNGLFAVASDVSDFELKLQLLTRDIALPAARTVTQDSAASTALANFMEAAQTTLNRIESWNATVPLETTSPEHTMLLSVAINDLQNKTDAFMDMRPHDGACLQCADAMAGFSQKCHTMKDRLSEMHYPELRQRKRQDPPRTDAELRQHATRLFTDLAGRPPDGGDDTGPGRPGGSSGGGRVG